VTGLEVQHWLGFKMVMPFHDGLVLILVTVTRGDRSEIVESQSQELCRKPDLEGEQVRAVPDSY